MDVKSPGPRSVRPGMGDGGYREAHPRDASREARSLPAPNFRLRQRRPLAFLDPRERRLAAASSRSPQANISFSASGPPSSPLTLRADPFLGIRSCSYWKTRPIAVEFHFIEPRTSMVSDHYKQLPNAALKTSIKPDSIF